LTTLARRLKGRGHDVSIGFPSAEPLFWRENSSFVPIGDKEYHLVIVSVVGGLNQLRQVEGQEA